MALQHYVLVTPNVLHESKKVHQLLKDTTYLSPKGGSFISYISIGGQRNLPVFVFGFFAFFFYELIVSYR